MTSSPDIVLDDKRLIRTGFDEAILCEQKSPTQIAEIVTMTAENDKSRLFTRLSKKKFCLLPPDVRALLRYAPDAHTAHFGDRPELSDNQKIVIVSAGSSDAKVVAEARETLRYYGQPSLVISDVGVAGLWRLMNRIDEIANIPVIIAVAGMDAALPTVLAGLVPGCIIGVPTSTGYGTARSGETALSAMLASCAPGLTVTNIDNGYGAAISALRLIRNAKAIFSA